MYLSRILISNFKNIREATLSFSKKINCISGNNGEGKTNLLDAIYYLSMTKSYFNPTDTYTFTFGEESTALNGMYIQEDATEDKISIGVKSGGEKIVKKNDKAYKKVSEHIGAIPIVMVSPADTSLINSSGEERRKFMNSILSQVDKEYLRRVMHYNQLLAQRNKLLKMPGISAEFLETINERMSPHAYYIYMKRAELCQRLQSLAKEFYAKLSGAKEEISLKYTSDLSNFHPDSSAVSDIYENDFPLDTVSDTVENDLQHGTAERCAVDENTLNKLFEKNRQRDIILRYTSSGVQRDDVEFCLGEHLIKKCGSQGQQKSFLIALKLAQFTLMKQLHGRTPILLLDDVFDKLDMQRVEYLLGLVASDEFGQIFISDSNKVRMSKIVSSVTKELQSYEVVGGVYSQVTE